VRRWLAIWAAGTLLGATACQHLPGGARNVRECPGALVPTGEIAGEFLIRQSWHVIDGSHAYRFELAVQHHDDALVLVGFHPLGAKLFTVTQRGTAVELVAQPPPALEVPPQNVLRDVHRLLFFALPAPDVDGWVRSTRGAVEISERWESGALRERRLDVRGDPTAAAVVTPASDDGSSEAATRVSHPGCGYEAEIRTLSRRSLP